LGKDLGPALAEDLQQLTTCLLFLPALAGAGRAVAGDVEGASTAGACGWGADCGGRNGLSCSSAGAGMRGGATGWPWLCAAAGAGAGVGTGCAWPERGAGFTAFLRTTTVGGVRLTTFLSGTLSPPSQTTGSSSCILPTAHTQGNAHSWWEYMAAYRQRDFFWFCRKFFRSSEMLKLCGTKTTRYCTSQVVFSNFATGRAAGNGSTPAGGSPVTVLPQEGCVVIPDSGCG
jgi:hypothetical protein